MKKILFFNTLSFLISIFLIEIIFGDWIKGKGWGNTLRSERLKKVSYSVKFDDQTHNFIYKKNSFGFRGDELSGEDLKVIFIGGSTTNQRFNPLELTVTGQLNKLLEK